MTSPNEPPDESWASPDAGRSFDEERPTSWGPAPDPGAASPPGSGDPLNDAPQTMPGPALPDALPPASGPAAPGATAAPGAAPGGGFVPGHGAWPGYGSTPGYGQTYGAGYGQHFGPGYGAGPAPAPQFAMAPKPGIVPLRPLTLGELLDGAFRAIRFNPKAMFLWPLILLAAASAIQALLFYVMYDQLGILSVFDVAFDPFDSTSLPAWTPSNGITAMVAAALTVVVTAVATLITDGVLTIAVSDAVIGRRPTMSDIWQRLRPRLWPLIGVSVLVTLIITVVFGVIVLVLVAVAVQNVAVMTVLAFLVAIPVMLVVGAIGMARFAMATPVVVLERRGPIETLSRSWRVVNGSFWRVLGILLLTSLLLGIVASVLSTPAQLGAMLAAMLGTGAGMWIVVAASALTTLLQQVVSVPFIAGVTTLLYIDIRMRREGLDVQLAKAAAE